MENKEILLKVRNARTYFPIKKGLARENLGSHGCRVCHAGASEGLYESLLDDTVLDVEGELAAALLRSAPADTVGKTGDVLDFFCMHPFALLGDGSIGVVGAFSNAAHLLHFFCVNHNNL